MHRTDGLLYEAVHLILKTIALKKTTTVILALSEPKPNVSSLSLAPNPSFEIFCSLNSYYPWVIREERRFADG